ncbi:MAG TPA: proton-conducting transporter membrane subunit [Jatrophihabitans sp.]|nr:proton-conducting transporter membrane subunit [Jatrophihabitans sp.]
MIALLVVSVLLPALAGLTCTVRAPRGAHGPGRLGAAATGVACAGAAVLCAAVAWMGPVAAVVTSRHGTAAFGLVADRLTAPLLLMVCGVSAVVQRFASRYLSGDPKQARLIAAAGLTTSAVAAVVTAATLGVLVMAWLLSGIGLLVLLGQRSDLPAARVGVRRAAAAFLVGDAALVLAAVLVWSRVGELDLRSVGTGARALAGDQLHLFGVGLGTLVACLLVIAAMARSAQLPLQRWLPATLAAPTPVSALLHAGLVNAGGILLVRLAPVFGLSLVATTLAFLVGSATALYGTVLMLVKPDLKGALAHSTMAQMGYMLLACSLGAFAAAVFHLVAHGMYKASLFLGADSAVHRAKWRATLPRPAAPRGPGWLRLTAAGLCPGVALALALATFASAALDHPGAIVLLAFAWVTAAQAGARWLAAAPAWPGLGLAAIAAGCLGYAGLLAGTNRLLEPVLGVAGHPVAAWLTVLPAGGFAAIYAASRRPGSRPWRLLYSWALDAGHVRAARLRTAPATLVAPAPAPARVPSVTG